MLEPIKKTIQVACDPDMAFQVFVSEMASWWPLDKFTLSAMKGAPATDIEVSAETGGTITEIGSDGTRTEWGVIKTYEPPQYIAMDFNIPAPGFNEAARSFLELRFTAVDGGTQVDLTQSNWEAFGDIAKDVHGGYGQGWGMIFEGAYKAACDAKTA